MTATEELAVATGAPLESQAQTAVGWNVEVVVRRMEDDTARTKPQPSAFETVLPGVVKVSDGT